MSPPVRNAQRAQPALVSAGEDDHSEDAGRSAHPGRERREVARLRQAAPCRGNSASLVTWVFNPCRSLARVENPCYWTTSLLARPGLLAPRRISLQPALAATSASLPAGAEHPVT